MRAYDAPGATRPIQEFVVSLSKWYVRLSRRRFWKAEDSGSAYATLYEVLTTVAYLLAPTMPFMAEVMYRNLVTTANPDAPDSVHLAAWPESNPDLIDQELMDAMALAERLVSLGRAARETVNLRVRQPLAEAAFGLRSDAERAALTSLSGLIADELNVKQVTLLDGGAGVVKFSLNPLPAKLGRKFGQNFPRVQKALREGSEADVTGWAAALLAGNNVTLTLDGQDYEVAPDEVEVLRGAAEGYALAEDAGYLAALDVTLSADLVREGLAREIVRRIQTMRRDADFEISDRIMVAYEGSARVAEAIEQHAEYISAETLADALTPGAPSNGAFSQEFAIDDEQVTLAVKRV